MTFTQVGRGGTYLAVSGDSLPTDDILPNSVVYLTDIQLRKLFDGSGWVDMPSPTVIALEDSEITASAAEINQALDGIGADVTAGNLTELTDGSETSLHQHALVDGGDDVTATAAEVNQALDGISADVTSSNLNELTGGTETALHSHAPSEDIPDPLTQEHLIVGEFTTRVQLIPAQGGAAGFTLDLSDLDGPASYVRFTGVLDLQGDPLENWQSVHAYVDTGTPDEVYGGGFVWTCMVGGNSDASEPDWSSPDMSGEITDDEVTWGDAVSIGEYVNLLGIASASGEGQRLALFNDILRADVPINLIHEGGASGEELTMPAEANYALDYHTAIDLIYATGGEESYWVPSSPTVTNFGHLPTADPEAIGQLYTLNGVLMVSNGPV